MYEHIIFFLIEDVRKNGVDLSEDAIPSEVLNVCPFQPVTPKEHCSHMCCNSSKNALPHLHAVASTLSSLVEFSDKRKRMRIAAGHSLTLFGGDETYAFAPSPAHNETYPIDNACVGWYKLKFDQHIHRIQQGKSFTEYFNSAIYHYIFLGLITDDYQFFVEMKPHDI